MSVFSQDDYSFLVRYLINIITYFEDTRKDSAASISVANFPDLPDFSRADAGDLNNAVQYFSQYIEPNLSASNGGRYLGFITGAVNPAALLGDWISALYDQNVVVNHDSIASRVERLTIKTLLEYFNVPTESFEGSFVTGATIGNYASFLLARQWAGKFSDFDIAEFGCEGLEFLVVCSSAHSSFYKALAMAGHGRANVIELSSPFENNIKNLENILVDNENTPVLFVATAGAVNFPLFDDFSKLKVLKEMYSNLWVHVDAAYGIYLGLLEEWEDTLIGIDVADSLVFDCHKMLNTPFDSAVFCTSHPELRVEVFKNIAPYLPNCDSSTLDFLHLGPENSRRFRALPTLFTLLSYGRQGVALQIKNMCDLGKYLASLIEDNSSLYLLGNNIANIVVFSIKNDPTEGGGRLVSCINQQGRFFLTPTTVEGVSCCRVAFGSWQTTHTHVDELFSQVIDAL